MTDIKYKLVGYINRHPKKNFKFLIPIFSYNDERYRCEIDDTTSKVIAFGLINSAYYEELNGYGDATKSVGDEGLYMFEYNNTIFKGDKIKIGGNLLKLIRAGALTNLEKYDIYFFLGIIEKIDECLNEIIKEFKSYGLEKDNFVQPNEILLDVNQFSNCLLFYSKLLENSHKALNYKDYYSESIKESLVAQFNKFLIIIDELRLRFKQLIGVFDSDIYKDLVIHSFINFNLQDTILLEPEFMLRKLIPITAVSEETIYANQILVKNSQSKIKTNLNITQTAMSLEKGMIKKREVNPTSLTKDQLIEIYKTKELYQSVKKDPK